MYWDQENKPPRSSLLSSGPQPLSRIKNNSKLSVLLFICLIICIKMDTLEVSGTDHWLKGTTEIWNRLLMGC
jgi:hypothetical protein